MKSGIFRQIEQSLNSKRLDAYRRDGVDDATTLARYLLNMALCETLYGPLQMAELTFGFWVGFFTRPHMTSGLAYHLGKTAFVHAPKQERDVPHLAARWQKVRDLRNRVFHHERILHWRDLETQHYQILQLIGWISPELEALARMLDQFSETRAAGIAPWREKLTAL